MPPTFKIIGPNQVQLQNCSSLGCEQMTVTLEQKNGFRANIEFEDESLGNGLVFSCGIAVDREALKKLVVWLRENGALDSDR